jgi:hypothetical protein
MVLIHFFGSDLFEISSSRSFTAPESAAQRACCQAGDEEGLKSSHKAHIRKMQRLNKRGMSLGDMILFVHILVLLVLVVIDAVVSIEKRLLLVLLS